MGETIMKILYLSEAVSLAHFGRPLVLAKIAQKHGFKNYFAVSDRIQQKMKSELEGVEVFNLPTIEDKKFYDRVQRCKFFYTVEELTDYVEAEVKLINELKPDLIVSDFRLTAPISASITNTPLLTITNAYWSPNSSCEFLPPAAGIFNLLPSNASLYLFKYLRPYFFKNFGKELNQVRQKYGLEKRNDFRELYTDGDKTAYLDLPQFVSLDSLPRNHFFLGPIIWSPKLADTTLPEFSKRYAYISLGSTGHKGCLVNVIKAVWKQNLIPIISGLNEVESKKYFKKLPRLKTESIIQPMIKPESILPYCKISICHGGSGTVYQSLSYGVPVICLPYNPDQSLVSLSVSQKQLGNFITLKDASVSRIEKEIHSCLNNPKIEERVIETKKAIANCKLEQNWLNLIYHFAVHSKNKKIIA